MTGSLSVLNVGAGDIEVRFNKHQPEEVARAITMLKDMQARGYAILVKQDDGSYVRAAAIDETHALYIISGEAPAVVTAEVVESDTRLAVTPRGKRGRQRRTQPIASSHAVGVGRSAGG